MKQHCRRLQGWRGLKGRKKTVILCLGWRAERGKMMKDPVGNWEDPGFYSQWHEKSLEGFNP